MNKIDEMYWELQGIVADYEHKRPFDDVSVRTVKRVQKQLVKLSKVIEGKK